MENKKILVTGANGLLASNLIRELVNRGFHVKGMIRKSSNLISLNGVNFEKIIGDITSKKDIDKAVSGCNYVVHVAANTAQSPSNYLNYVPVNVRATKNIIDAIKKHKTKRLIFVSTANTLGCGSKENPGKETDPFMQFLKKSGYALSKYVAQQIVVDAAKKNEINAVIVNPTFMIGAFDAKPGSGKIIQMAYQKKIQLYPTGGKNFIHVKDAAIGICNAIEKGKNGECYLLAGKNLSYKEFFNLLNEVTGSKSFKIKVPGILLKSIGLIGNLLEKMSISFNLTKVNTDLLCLDNYYSPQKAINELNLPQTPIKVAIKEAVDWFRENGYL